MKRKKDYGYLILLIVSILFEIFLTYQLYSGFFNGQLMTKYGGHVNKDEDVFYLVLVFYVVLFLVGLFAFKALFSLIFRPKK